MKPQIIKLSTSLRLGYASLTKKHLWIYGFMLLFSMLNIFPLIAQNPIVTENALPGNPISEWYITGGTGSPTIQGFATDISVNKGNTINFKVSVNPISTYNLKIYRMGYYQGNGARLITNLGTFSGVIQPDGSYDDVTGLTDCNNWSQTGSWAVPSTAVSGVYFALLTRTDNGEKNNIIFVVRDDAANSPVLFKTSDATWQAYNAYGGHNFYFGPTTQFSHAVKASYNRPFTTSGQDWILNAEYPMIRFLERNGYDMTYTTDVDMDRDVTPITTSNHIVLLSVGHDEYWSADERIKFETARDNGVHLAFFSGNEIYWKTRWEDNHRTLVCYKEGTLGEYTCGTKCDPSPLWTGLWRDGCTPPYAANDGCRPENELTGQISWVDGSGSIQVPYAYKDFRIWRNTSIANLQSGQTVTFPYGTLGSEWDPEKIQYPYPPHRMKLSSTLLSGQTHNLSLYRHPSGALVFGAGTIQWSWGLDSIHDRGNAPPNIDMQQATVNILADMEVLPGSLMTQLIDPATPPDLLLPSSIITSLNHEDVLPGIATIITGTASDAGGIVAGVEISFDGGTSWNNVTGATSWSYTWQPTSSGLFNIKTRAWDDSGNLEVPGPLGSSNNINVTVTNPIYYSLFPPTLPSSPPQATIGNGTNSLEVGMKFKSSTDGFITGLKYYKAAGFVGTHVGNLWNINGTNLATATFTNETASGWQTVTLSTPVAITANTIYVVSYFSPHGDFVTTNPYFTADVVNGSLTGLGWTTTQRNGVYIYSSTSAYPYQNYGTSNYWADILFTTSLNPDVTPPNILSVSPENNAVNVSLTFQPFGTFSEALAPNTVNTSTFLIYDPQNNPVTGSVNLTGNSVIFVPADPFSYSTVYTATFKGGSQDPRIKDLAGNPLESDYSWSFTTISPTLPIIISHPESQNACVDSEVSFFSNAFGTPTPTVQWQVSDDGGNSWNDILNAISPEYTFIATVDDNNYQYRAIWTNIVGSVNSDSAILNVISNISGTIESVNPAICPGSLFEVKLVSATGDGPFSLLVNGKQYTEITVGQTFASIPIRETIWLPTAVPTIPASSDVQAIEVGVKFKALSDGFIKGIRFYKGTGNTGVHTGSLWSIAGTQLATATFTNETSTGWQEVLFAAPVAISANTIYVASYFAPVGRYAKNDNYFASGPYSNTYSLEALANSSGQPNGVYVYTPTGGFPNQNFGSPNYWVDVVFSYSDNDTFISHLTSIADSNGCVVTGAPLSTATATLSPAPAGIISSAGTVCEGSDVSLVYSNSVGTEPFSLMVNGNTFNNVASGVPFNVGNTGTTAPARSIWSNNTTGTAYTDVQSTEVGVKFRSSQPGQITGIRFYKSSTANGGVHTGTLWSSAGNILATATFTNETSSGWQSVIFDTPVDIVPNVTYLASYIAPNGHYARDLNYFTSTGFTNGPLTALQAGVDGPNGVYIYSTGGVFPTQFFQNANYWVDVLFTSYSQNYFALTGITDGNGCSSSGNPIDTTTVAMYELPVVNIDQVSPMCFSAAPFELTAQPAGGIYSGTGITGNTFDPAISGSGTFKITYTYTDGNGCDNSDSTDIIVYDLPEVTIDTVFPMCISAAPIELTAQPTGGTFSGTGMTGITFDPTVAGAGTWKIKYFYTDIDGCSNSDSTDIIVYDLPIVTIDPVSPMCISASTVEVTAMPTGGTFTGTGMTGNIFDPAVAGAGTWKIKYFYTDIDGCSNSDSTDIIVYDLPEVTIDTVFPMCISAAPIELTAQPTGGTFSGTGMTGNTFDPIVAGAGTWKIKYFYTDIDGCSNSDSTDIIVYDLPIVTIDPVSPMCISASQLELTATPTGGTFSGTGMTGSIFNPAGAGAGTWKIKYFYTDIDGCMNSDSTDIVVYDLPIVSIDPVAPLYVSDPPVILSATPLGGVFSGTGVTGSTFDPAISGAGNFEIVYTFMDVNGCQNSDTTEIVVNANLTNALSLKVFIEGPFNETAMNTWLNAGGQLPLTQPYSPAPWNYPGTESFSVIPNPDVVDWVLVELRDAVDAVSATPATRISRQAALLLKDGSIVGTDGFSALQVSNTIVNQLFVVIWHRNHLAVMSAAPLVLSAGVYSYDFSVGESQAYGGLLGHKEIFAGIWGMFGGDANSNGTIEINDKESFWKPQAGKIGYKPEDFNMNSQVENNDKNDIWLPNISKGTQVPN